MFKSLFSVYRDSGDVIGVRRRQRDFYEFLAEIKNMTTTLKQALKTHFGFDDFRSKKQEDVVKAVVRRKYTKVSLSAGLTRVYLYAN